MVSEAQLLDAVEAAFEITARGLRPWADPHPDRSPLDEEYSRVTDAAKWRIVGARADAWIRALTELGLAEVTAPVDVAWTGAAPTIARSARVAPTVPGGLVLVIGRSRLEDVDDAGTVIGIGDPPDCVTWLPDCGCDACDSGSQNELDLLDRHLLDVVSGAFRRLTAPGRVIVAGRDGWSATNLKRRDDVGAILANPVGWHDQRGPSWLGDAG